ncbi:exosome complex protein Rrp42 [Candidatus Woesearchaeota archaeon]|nr:exosome complex protein Rrp42 [Candidatus Woesearchaeota archaeon]
MKEHLLKSLKKGVRYDGRKLDEFRKVTVSYDVSKSAEGSAKVTFGGTHVLVGVKMGVETPYPDTPDRGNFMVNAELTPLSSNRFESGPPSIEAIELSRVVDRGIRESKAIDQKALCIKVAEKVWSVMVDVVTVNADGNLLDAAGLGALAALKVARFPKYENDIIDYMTHTDKKVPLVREPLPVTVFKIGEYLLVDPLPIEEQLADARLTITVTGDNTICALQKGGEVPLSSEDILSMTDIALKIAPELRKKL